MKKMAVLILTFTLLPSHGGTLEGYDTVAGNLFARFGPSRNSDQTFPLSTIILAVRSDIETITFRQGDEFECKVVGNCRHETQSRTLWLVLRFKDNSQAKVRLEDIDSRRIDFMYSHSLTENTTTTRIVTHGPDKEPILVRTFSGNPPQYQTIRDSEIVSLVLGIYFVRISGHFSKRLTKESNTLITTSLDIESTLPPHDSLEAQTKNQ